MCPMCMTSAVVIAASSASGAGVLGLLIVKLRSLRMQQEPARRPDEDLKRPVQPS